MYDVYLNPQLNREVYIPIISWSQYSPGAIFILIWSPLYIARFIQYKIQKGKINDMTNSYKINGYSNYMGRIDEVEKIYRVNKNSEGGM